MLHLLFQEELNNEAFAVVQEYTRHLDAARELRDAAQGARAAAREQRDAAQGAEEAMEQAGAVLVEVKAAAEEVEEGEDAPPERRKWLGARLAAALNRWGAAPRSIRTSGDIANKNDVSTEDRNRIHLLPNFAQCRGSV